MQIDLTSLVVVLYNVAKVNRLCFCLSCTLCLNTLHSSIVKIKKKVIWEQVPNEQKFNVWKLDLNEIEKSGFKILTKYNAIRFSVEYLK